jgi:hypothetical protein
MPFTFSMPAVPMARPGIRVAPFRYEPGVGYQPLESIAVVEISVREGPEPSKAIFEYITGDISPSYLGLGFEDVLPIVRLGNPRVVDVDERIVVAGLTPTGELYFLFDGFAQMPEGKFDDKMSSLTFVAQGVEVRAWDEPLGYSVWRDVGDPTNPQKIVWTALPVRFNPRVGPLSVANCTPEGWESNSDGGRKFSVFIDPLCRDNTVKVRGVDTAIAREWDLAAAVGYILAEGNWDETYVRLQDVDYLDKLLKVMVPKSGRYLDPTNPNSYDYKPIIIPDTDATGDPWPDALWKILRPNGYGMCFRLAADDNGDPVTWLDIYKLNDNDWSKYKDLYLQEWNEILDPSASNVGGASFANDISDIANVVSVDTAPVRKEVGVILAPLFEIKAGDLDAGKAGKFSKKDPDFKDVIDKYRLFGADETGEGHYVFTVVGPGSDGKYTISNLDWKKDIIDFEDVFGVDDQGAPRWVQRRRPAFSTMWTKDVKDAYLQAELYISVDYKGPMPSVWDGKSGTWTKVTAGFAVARDRLGIRITHENPNAWNIGKMPRGAPGQISAGEVRVVDWLANTVPEGRKAFTLMLVCCIESDQHLNVTATRRDTSPTSFDINRIVSLRDKLRPGEIHPSSIHHPDHGTAGAEPIVTGSEEADALDYAVAKRESRQLGKWAGTVTIPRLTDSYIIGDRIRSVVGRGANMQTNLGGNGREAPVYPRVIGITYSFSRGQHTSLNLTDARGDNGGRYG